MDQNLSDRLNQASQYIKAGRLLDAQKILVDVVMQFPGSEQGWYLLSLTAQEPYQQVDCLEHVLRINPNNTPARLRLAKIQASPEYKKIEENREHVSPFVNAEPFMAGREKPDAVSSELKSRPITEPGLPPADPATTAAPRRARWPWVLALAVVLLLAVLAAVYFGGFLQRPVATATPLPTNAPVVARTFPPTWTPTPTLPTVTPSPRPTHTPALTASPTVMLTGTITPTGP